MSAFKKYPRKGFVEARPYIGGEDLSGVSVSEVDKGNLDGGYIARNPDNHADQWFIAEEYFRKNYDSAGCDAESCTKCDGRCSCDKE